jgi:rSAM/selenodomain-associated transferase 1
MLQKKDNALIVFLRYPETKKGKTRLGKDIGDRRAMELYRETAGFVADSFSGQENWTTFFFYTPEERRKEVFKWLGDKEALFFAQETGSLGQRMSHAFSKCFSLGFRNVVIIGTDCVMITEEDVETAFSLLSGGEFEAVLGPATDGGYYLLGLCRETDAVFKDMQWSSARVFRETERRMRESGLRHAVMRELSDIDEEKDINIKDIMTRDAELGRRLTRVLSEDQKNKRESA